MKLIQREFLGNVINELDSLRVFYVKTIWKYM